MKRWSTQSTTQVESPRTDAFLADIEGVFARHGLSIGHEDQHGAFIVEPLTPYNVEWLRDARVGDIGPDPQDVTWPNPNGVGCGASGNPVPTMTPERRALLTGLAAAALWVPVDDVVVGDDGTVSLRTGPQLSRAERDSIDAAMRLLPHDGGSR